MKEITTVGLDLAKNVFQVHAVDAEGGQPLRGTHEAARRELAAKSAIAPIRGVPGKAGTG